MHAAASGGAFFSPLVAHRVLNADRPAAFAQARQSRAALERLTKREQEVARLVGKNHSNTEIAAELFMAEGTVKTHMSSIFRTTGARNRVEAALIAVRAVKA